MLCFPFLAKGQQSKFWLWPISGQQTGEGIILKPQQYIDKELNFDKLFIAAPEGTAVLAPTNGILESFDVSLSKDFVTEIGWGENNGESINSIRENIKKEVSLEKYYTGSISINIGDNKILSIQGISGDKKYKSGQRINRGDTLGYVSYAYQKISQPHIEIHFYQRHGTSQDPMAPFGLKSTFIPPQKEMKPEYLSSLQAKEDLEILLTAFQECFPSGDEILTEQQVEEFRKESFAQIMEGISYREFHNIIRSVCSAKLYHDTHIDILTPLQIRGTIYVPHLGLGLVADTLKVCQVQPGLEGYIGKVVSSVDNISAQELIEKVRDEACIGYDGKNRSVRDAYMLVAWNSWYFNDVCKPRRSVIKFADGTEYIDDWTLASKTKVVPIRSSKIARYKNIVEASKNKIRFKLLNDSTIYFALSSFNINDIEMESIADSINKYKAIPYMIVDVRNNPGGESKNVDKLVSFFIQNPTFNLKSYKKIILDTTSATIKYSINYTKDLINNILSQGYEKRDGFYYKATNSIIQPDSITNYSGKLYIITDETSVSAATLFPSILVRNNRAVSVGRETASCYHYITALDNIDILLPNSKIVVRIPFVKSVFEEKTTPRTPAGRGLMPDYEVSISYEEFFLSEEDMVLKRALELIHEGKYIESTTFFTEESKDKKVNWTIIFCIIATAIFSHLYRRIFAFSYIFDS